MRLVLCIVIVTCAYFAIHVAGSLHADEGQDDLGFKVHKIIEEARQDPKNKYIIINQLKGIPGVTRLLRAYIEENDIKGAIIGSLAWEEEPENLLLLSEIMVRNRPCYGKLCMRLILNFRKDFLTQNIEAILENLLAYAKMDTAKKDSLFTEDGYRALWVLLKAGPSKHCVDRVKAVRAELQTPITGLYADVLIYAYGSDDSGKEGILSLLKSSDLRIVGHALEGICITRRKELGVYLLPMLDDTRVIRNVAVSNTKPINQRICDLAAGVLEDILIGEAVEDPHMKLITSPRLRGVLQSHEIDDIRARYLKWLEEEQKK